MPLHITKRSSVCGPPPCTFTKPTPKVRIRPGQIRFPQADSLYIKTVPTIVIAPEMKIANLRFLFIPSVEPNFLPIKRDSGDLLLRASSVEFSIHPKPRPYVKSCLKSETHCGVGLGVAVADGAVTGVA